MRNIDEIRKLRAQVQDLQYEIGRRNKKIGEQGKEIRLLRERLDHANEGNRQTQQLVDAVLMAVVEAHGVDAEDPDKPGMVLGKRLTVPGFSASEIREKYELHARKDMESDTYVLGIMPREEAPCEEAEPAQEDPEEKGAGEA